MNDNVLIETIRFGKPKFLIMKTGKVYARQNYTGLFSFLTALFKLGKIVIRYR